MLASVPLSGVTALVKLAAVVTLLPRTVMVTVPATGLTPSVPARMVSLQSVAVPLFWAAPWMVVLDVSRSWMSERVLTLGIIAFSSPLAVGDHVEGFWVSHAY